MKIFIAGASGAIGQPLITALLRQGHSVTGMTQSDAGAKKLIALGAEAVIANALDASAVEVALRNARAEVVIDELTSLPKDPADMPAAAAGDRKLRIEGGGNLLRAARSCGVRRYMQQSSGFFLTSDQTLAEESATLAIHASPGIAASARTYTELEARMPVLPMESVLLRYGFFYGPNTWYYPDGGAADSVRKQQQPLIGNGQGVWSFLHIEDAALATVEALTAEPGTYNIVDSDPSPISRWLPAFAKSLGAPAPPRITEQEALATAGEDAVYYQTKLQGASNRKAMDVLKFRPRPLEWLTD